MPDPVGVAPTPSPPPPDPVPPLDVGSADDPPALPGRGAAAPGRTSRVPRGAGPARRIAAALLSPIAVLVLVGSIAGLALAFRTPALSGIDETSHFARAFQISEGVLVPVDPPAGVEGVGVCLPAEVRDDLQRQLERNFFGGLVDPSADSYQGIRCERADPRQGKYLEIATFSWYPAIGYAPEAAAILVGRVVGVDTLGLTAMARVASLFAYLGVAAVAVRRSTRAQWTLVVVALLPVALVQAAMSTGPDGMSLALVLLVVSSVLRLTDTPDVSTRRFVAEAAVLGLALGLTKPIYGVVALAYVLPLWRHPEVRRSAGLVATMAPFAGSIVWYQARSSQFLCDVRHFNVVADPSGQAEALLREPGAVVGAAVDGFSRYGVEWMHRLALVNEWTYDQRVEPGTTIGLTLLLGGGLLVVAGAGGRPGAGSPPLLARLVFAPLAVAVVLGVFAGWLLYCNPAGFEILWPPHVRLFVPGLALLLVALTTSCRWLRIRGVPLALPLYLAGVVWGVAAVISVPI